MYALVERPVEVGLAYACTYAIRCGIVKLTLGLYRLWVEALRLKLQPTLALRSKVRHYASTEDFQSVAEGGVEYASAVNLPSSATANLSRLALLSVYGNVIGIGLPLLHLREIIEVGQYGSRSFFAHPSLFFLSLPAIMVLSRSTGSSPMPFFPCSPADMAVGGGLILVGVDGGLGAIFFIADAVAAPLKTVVAIIAAVPGSHIIFKCCPTL